MTNAIGKSAADFRLLGPFQASVNGEPLNVEPGRQQRMIIGLLAAKGHSISRESLISWIWDELPQRPRQALDRLMWAVRKHLTSAGLPNVLFADGDGLCRLEVAPDSVDVHRFDALVSRARNTGDEAHRAEMFREALEMFYGIPLEGLSTTQIDGYRTTLLGKRSVVQIEYAKTEIRLGRHARLAAELRPLTRADPKDEQMAALCMVAQYYTGSRAEALETFQNTRRALRDELGADVSKELGDLHHRMLNQDPTLDLPEQLIALPEVASMPSDTPDTDPNDLITATGDRAMVSKLIINNWSGRPSAEELAAEPPNSKGTRHANGHESMGSDKIINIWDKNEKC